MTERELYEELGRKMGLTAETEFVDATRKLAGAAIGRIVTDLLGAKTITDLDKLGRAVEDVGDNMREMVAKRVEGEAFAQSHADDVAMVRSSGFDKCPDCGKVGEHLCSAMRPKRELEDEPTPPLDTRSVIDASLEGPRYPRRRGQPVDIELIEAERPE